MKNIKEIWKDIPGYEGFYKASNLGKIKSLERKDTIGRYISEKVLKPSDNTKGYLAVNLYKENKSKYLKIHVLVAMAFLNHKPCGHKKIVHHKDNNSKNNYLSNLEITTQRKNCITHYKGTSQYRGVHWSAKQKKWIAQIRIKDFGRYLGSFDCEIKAHKCYTQALNKHLNE